ncbi:MAG: hypothetical protein PHY02_06570 [Phycisphaerae bacterium]|nr:hypothetical protein [Phycisphaerae bacterium]
MGKCKHKKLILLSAHNIRFGVDQEPYEAGKEECAGISEVNLESGITAHYCPKCGIIVDINIEPGQFVTTEPCDCEKHHPTSKGNNL